MTTSDEDESVSEGCREATYRAEQGPRKVTITAEGEHPSLGYKQYFERSLIAVCPPEFTFYHDRPTEPNGYKVIPFKETTSLEATEPVDRVVITYSDVTSWTKKQFIGIHDLRWC